MIFDGIKNNVTLKQFLKLIGTGKPYKITIKVYINDTITTFERIEHYKTFKFYSIEATSFNLDTKYFDYKITNIDFKCENNKLDTIIIELGEQF